VLDRDDLNRRIEGSNVRRIRRHDSVATPSRTQDNRCIDDVRPPPNPTQLTGLTRALIVERLDLEL
jgi:hypothetical protein